MPDYPTKEDRLKMIQKCEDGYKLTGDVPGARSPFARHFFSSEKDAEMAADIAFHAFEGGKWAKQQEIRKALGIRPNR